MPRNDKKVLCSIPGCRAWAVHGSDPPRCSPHSGLVGAPPGNTNALVHGYFASVLPPEEATGATSSTLDAEIRMARAALRRLQQMLETGTTLGPHPQPLTPEDYARFIGLTFQGTGTISRLLRARAARSDFVSEFARMIDETLGEPGTERGVRPT